eukprot:6189247-Pleurochrysis_carterae.AAC.1
MPLTSCECSMAAIVALVAVEAALASAASRRSNSLPLPLQANAYVRCAAWQVIVRRMRRFASSAVSGGRPEDATVPAAGAAEGAGACDDAVWMRLRS